MLNGSPAFPLKRDWLPRIIILFGKCSPDICETGQPWVRCCVLLILKLNLGAYIPTHNAAAPTQPGQMRYSLQHSSCAKCNAGIRKSSRLLKSIKTTQKPRCMAPVNRCVSEASLRRKEVSILIQSHKVDQKMSM